MRPLTERTLDELALDVAIEAVYNGRHKRNQPMLMDDDAEWEHDSWAVTLTYQGRRYGDISYHMGIAHSPMPPAGYAAPERQEFYRDKQHGGTWKATPPSSADILSSLILDSSGLECGFESWAENIGYDTDSRRAEAIYKQCLETVPRIHNLLGSDFETFERAAEDY